MRRGASTMICAVVAAALNAGEGYAATIAVDLNTRHQSFEGFAATRDNIKPWQEKVGPFYETVDLSEVGFYDSIAQDWHMARLALEPIQDSLDAPYNDINLTHVMEMKQAGITRFWASPLSPPAWMKDNQSFTNGGHLLPEYYDDFARMCGEYCRQFKEKTGLDLYGLCLQVEPGFVEPYGSCVYDQVTYHDLMSVAGPILDSVSPSTKILAPQDVLNSFWTRSNSWMNALMDDSATRPYVDVYAVNCHNSYFDSATAPARTWWNGVRSVADPNGLALWLTSTGDRLDTLYASTIRIAAAAANTFKYGNASVWTWYSFCNSSSWAVVKKGRYTSTYYQLAHFGRFVKPGAVRVETAADGPAALAEVAFQNTDGSLVIVLVNATGSSEEITLSGADIPDEFHLYQTTGDSSLMNDLGEAPAAQNLTLPPMSTTSLVSDATNAVRPGHVPKTTAVPDCRWVVRGRPTGVTVETPAGGALSFALYSPNGHRIAGVTTRVRTGDEVTLSPPGSRTLAAGTYVARVRVTGHGRAFAHTTLLSVR